jgi:hypothetical protein
MRAAASIIVAVFALAAINNPKSALAVTINGITFSNQYIIGDDRSINDVGLSPGFDLSFGGDISGGSAGYSGAGIFTPSGATTPTIVQALTPCAPPSIAPTVCGRTTTFTPSKLNGTWSFEVGRGTTTAVFDLPPANAIPTMPLPFPSNVTITNSANGVNPTISWTLPGGLQPDAFRFLIYDRSSPPLANGTDNVIHLAVLPDTAAIQFRQL